VQAQLVAIVGLFVATIAILRWTWHVGDRTIEPQTETEP
jgi:hypothetical protein